MVKTHSLVDRCRWDLYRASKATIRDTSKPVEDASTLMYTMDQKTSRFRDWGLTPRSPKEIGE
jgi:hypothetical protein